MKLHKPIPIWIICVLFALWIAYGVPLLLGIILLVIRMKQDSLYKKHLEELQADNNRMRNTMTPEMEHADAVQKLIIKLEDNKASLQNEIERLELKNNKTINEYEKVIHKLDNQITLKKQQLVTLDDAILFQEFGLYQPKYDFINSDQYKERLAVIREKQQQSIKNKTAVTGNMNWTVNGNSAKGKKMVADMQKLLLRAFNCECDETINKVKFNNYDASLKRITSSKETISKLGTIMDVAITDSYYDLKVQELSLALEYQIKKQEEKEALKEARAEMREAAKLQKEIEEQRKKAEKEQSHYQRALLVVLKQLESAPESEKKELIEKKQEYEKELGLIETSLKDIDYREANQRAGYVYVVSNIGAFGENIYKIGMTRRLDPQERIDELGNASVPFNFDVHAMIFTDDAPKLEAALHKAFENKKVNMVNQRREFFHVTLEEIKKVVKENFDKTVEFIDIPDAEQYRITQKMIQSES